MGKSSETKFSILINKISKSKYFEYFKTNTLLVVTISSAIITIGSFVIKLFDYLELKGRLSVYNIASEYIKINTPDNFVSFVNRSVVFIGFGINLSPSSYCRK